MFLLEPVCIYRLVCVQVTFACSNKEREEEKRKTGRRKRDGKNDEDNAIGVNRSFIAL